MSAANSSIRAEVFKRANAKYPDPGVGKDVQYRNPGSGGTDEPMLITDPNTGEIYRVGGARSANQMRALKPSNKQKQSAPKKQTSKPKKEKVGLLRRAGQMFDKFDQAYANAADRRSMPVGMQLGHALPISLAADYIQLPPNAAAKQPLGVTAARKLGNAAFVGANVASRYALPAGGLTLAGAGLADLTAAFGSIGDQPEPMQLTM